MTATSDVQKKIVDRRSGRVIFVSHCLLNENVRYLGGACRPGPIGEYLEEWRSAGVGICQMPCPEQRAWGGVTKRFITPAFAARKSALWPLRRLAVLALVAFTKVRYRLIAHHVAGEIEDYQRSGYQVTGLVGVAASPSCGVGTTLDVGAWLDAVGQVELENLEASTVNRAVITSARPGRGWFMTALVRRLENRGIVPPPLLEHDLLAELATVSDPVSQAVRPA